MYDIQSVRIYISKTKLMCSLGYQNYDIYNQDYILNGEDGLSNEEEQLSCMNSSSIIV